MPLNGAGQQTDLATGSEDVGRFEVTETVFELAFRIGQRELALLEFEDGDVGGGSGLECAEFVFAMQVAGRCLGDSPHHFGQLHAEMQEHYQ